MTANQKNGNREQSRLFMSPNNPYHAGLDVGSTTLKLVIIDPQSHEIVFSDYRRHQAAISETLRDVLALAAETIGETSSIGLIVTGSAGLGLAEAHDIPFMQEVIAAGTMASHYHPEIKTLIDIGGEDSKIIFFDEGHAPDIRMNGSCAGGTGAFIDQIATLLGCETQELNSLAASSTQVYPIASRCGVFARTDIQNLLSRNISPADIAASSFHAVAQQIVTTLARGRDIKPKLLFCGGPLAFIPMLRHSCREVMGISEHDCVIPENAQFIPALGCAIAQGHERKMIRIHDLSTLMDASSRPGPSLSARKGRLPRLFADADHYQLWKEEKERHQLITLNLEDMAGTDCFLGIDSGSTTTKIVALDSRGSLIFSFYKHNRGNPLETVYEGLKVFYQSAISADKSGLRIAASTVTGYGEDLIKAAFGLDFGLVETIAHYQAARNLDPDVSFILDIGGQDMKAIFIEHGAIVRLDINEACSSGCGSFIDGFAQSLQYGAARFAAMACTADSPCDLGTRCTVFMNSMVKQSLRENAPLPDIAAGLAYSVAKNCLYKVLKIKSVDELGSHIVLQGGTMRNHAVVRAFELLAKCRVVIAPMPELMGAYGAALHSVNMRSQSPRPFSRLLADLVTPVNKTTVKETCPGCENRCTVQKHAFDNGNTFVSGNKCEKVFTSRGEKIVRGANMHAMKYRLLFSRSRKKEGSSQQTSIGIPRVLNYYENFPFWHALLTHCGFNIVLSAASTFKLYHAGAGSIMSDNICFPAKLVHGHIHDLVSRKVDRILMPFIVHERQEGGKSANSYNCPIVTGYSDVIRSSMNPADRYGIPLDSPTMTFNHDVLLKKACRRYMAESLGVRGKRFSEAFQQALSAQHEYAGELTAKIRSIIDKNRNSNRLLIVLAGRPYHTDPLIQHKVADIISEFGADVINEDVARSLPVDPHSGTVEQWAYPNRILKAAEWTAQAPENVHFVQLTSFGCGPDAFIMEAAGEILKRKGKSHTILKVDDVNNPGSLRLRIRSLIESLAHRDKGKEEKRRQSSPSATAVFTAKDKKRTLLVPFFSEIYSPFLAVLFKLMGYHAVTLPPPNSKSIDYGLQYANNEVCYPATLVIGDFIQALESGRYRRDETAVVISQTGGQCRASNYISLIRKALASAGYADIPVIALGAEKNDITNEQPGFQPRLRGNIIPAISAILYADRIARMYYASAPREIRGGEAARLRDLYIKQGAECMSRRDTRGLCRLLQQAADDFNNRIDTGRTVPRMGIVGEIYVKYNASGNRNIIEWLISQGVEPVVPSLIDFFLQYFPNLSQNRSNFLTESSLTDWLGSAVYWWIRHYQKKFDQKASSFAFHQPGEDIFTKSRKAKNIINLAAQYGEGWLIPAELAEFAENGIHHAVSLQPFGCIANHLVSKGMERRICSLYPDMSLLFLDLDSGASEANMFNRLHFMIQSAKNTASPQRSRNQAHGMPA